MTDELQETATGMMIFRVDLEVLGEIGDALAEECDLYFGGAGVNATVLPPRTAQTFTPTIEGRPDLRTAGDTEPPYSG